MKRVSVYSIREEVKTVEARTDAIDCRDFKSWTRPRALDSWYCSGWLDPAEPPAPGPITPIPGREANTKFECRVKPGHGRHRADAPAYSWVSTYSSDSNRYLTQAEYEKLNPEARRWFQPIAPGAAAALVRLVLEAKKANDEAVRRGIPPLIDRRAIQAAEDALRDAGPLEAPRTREEVQLAVDKHGSRWRHQDGDGVIFEPAGFEAFVEQLLGAPLDQPIRRRK